MKMLSYMRGLVSCVLELNVDDTLKANKFIYRDLKLYLISGLL